MKKILIVAHDAGGAEIISSWVKANPKYSYYFLLQGPAVSIFSRKIQQLQNYLIDDLIKLITKVDFILTGTSWASDLERAVISIAKSQGIFVSSYLDHWTNYLERFLYQDGYSFPDEIWVGDYDAKVLATALFDKIPIRFVPNLYFIEVEQEYKIILNSIHRNIDEKLINILYICEPVSSVSFWKTGDEMSRGYTEYTGLQFFFDCFEQIQIRKFLNKIKLRLHPSEKKTKYDALIKEMHKKNLPVCISDEATLLKDLAWADYVVGISSMALVIAAQLNKKTFTCIPEGAIVTKLPLQGIKPFSLVNIGVMYD